MKQLKEHDWINEREEKKQGKGRPYNIYSLKVGFNDIITQLEKQQRKARRGSSKDRAVEGIREIVKRCDGAPNRSSFVFIQNLKSSFGEYLLFFP